MHFVPKSRRVKRSINVHIQNKGNDSVSKLSPSRARRPEFDSSTKTNKRTTKTELTVHVCYPRDGEAKTEDPRGSLASSRPVKDSVSIKLGGAQRTSRKRGQEEYKRQRMGYLPEMKYS